MRPVTAPVRPASPALKGPVTLRPAREVAGVRKQNSPCNVSPATPDDTVPQLITTHTPTAPVHAQWATLAPPDLRPPPLKKAAAWRAHGAPRDPASARPAQREDLGRAQGPPIDAAGNVLLVTIVQRALVLLPRTAAPMVPTAEQARTLLNANRVLRVGMEILAQSTRMKTVPALALRVIGVG